MANGSINLKITPNLVIHMQDSSKDTWNTLEKQFGTNTAGTCYPWVQKLLDFAIKGDEHPVKEFACLNTIRGQVTANKVSLDEYVIALLVLKRLPKKYEMIASTITGTTPREELTLQLISDCCVAEFERVNKAKPLANQISAVKTKGQNPKSHQQKQAGPSNSAPDNSLPPPNSQKGKALAQKKKKHQKRAGEKVKARQAIAIEHEEAMAYKCHSSY